MEKSRAATRRAEREAQIVSAAEKLFHERSYDEVTMKDIAEAVGISPGLIYRYRASKAEILADIIMDYVTDLAAHLGGCEVPGGSAEERVMWYLKEMFAFDLERIELRRLAVAQSWLWPEGTEYAFEWAVLKIFEPMIKAVAMLDVELDLSARWAIWAIYTEALRRYEFDVKTIDDFEREIGPQVLLVVRGVHASRRDSHG